MCVVKYYPPRIDPRVKSQPWDPPEGPYRHSKDRQGGHFEGLPRDRTGKRRRDAALPLEAGACRKIKQEIHPQKYNTENIEKVLEEEKHWSGPDINRRFYIFYCWLCQRISYC